MYRQPSAYVILANATKLPKTARGGTERERLRGNSPAALDQLHVAVNNDDVPNLAWRLRLQGTP